MSRKLEPVDQKGLVNRERVIDQTIFDYLLMLYKIELPEHEAAHRFMESLAMSGASIPSIDPSKIEEPREARRNSDSENDRRMIFSHAYRTMIEGSDEKSAGFVMNWCYSPYGYSKDPDDIEAIAATLRPGLRALSRHYGCTTRDPRRIIRSQVYGGR